MANKKSIVEEALLEAKQIEEAVKTNSKGLLAGIIQKDIDQMVKASLKENEDELADDELDTDQETPENDQNATNNPMGDVPTGDMEDPLGGSDTAEEDSLEGSDTPEDSTDTEVDITSTDDAGDSESPEDSLGSEEDDDTVDMTDASDDDLITVFKKMGDDDEIEVVKDGKNINIKDKGTGSEYMIKLSESIADEIDPDTNADESITDEAECTECNNTDEGEEPMYEITFDDDNDDFDFGLEDGDSNPEKLEDNPDDMHFANRDRGFQKSGHLNADNDPEDTDWDLNFDLNFDESTRRTKADNRLNNLKPSNHPAKKMDESTKKYQVVIKEYNELKSKYSQTKEALKVFRDKLNEIALYNTNMSNAVKLFMEHATTKTEKINIMKKFDSEAKTLKESQRVYKIMSNELKDRKPISKKVDEKLNETISKASSNTLVESKVYVDPQIAKIHEMMDKLDGMNKK